MSAMSENRYRYLMVQFFTLVRLPLAISCCILIMLCREIINQPLTMQQLFREPPLDLLAVLAGGVAILITIEITDYLDGNWARRYQVTSEWGAMLDPYADSVGRIIVYSGLVYSGLALPYTPIVLAIRDITIAYCRIILAHSGQSVKAKWSGKIKAVIQGVGAMVLLVGPIYWVLLKGVPIIGDKKMIGIGSWIIILATIASMPEYLKAAWSALHSKKS